jgi:ATP-binding cassette subfamily B protein
MEVLSIGSLIPIIGILVAPVGAVDLEVLLNFKQFLVENGIENELQFVLIIFVAGVLLTCLLRLKLVDLTTKFSYGTGIDVGDLIFEGMLNAPYEEFVTLSSSEIIDLVANKILNVVIIVMMATTLVSSMILYILFTATLLFVDYKSTIVVVSLFGLMYYFIAKVTKIKLNEYSRNISFESKRQVKVTQEAMNGIREILISNAQEVFLDLFREINFKLRYSQGRNHFYSLSPRYTVEAAGLILLVALSYFLISILQNANAFIILAAIAFSAQRLLPLMQQSYVSWATIKGTQNSLVEVLDWVDKFSEQQKEFLMEAKLENFRLDFKKEIFLKDISFWYKHSNVNVLKNLNLHVSKGDFIGIIGATGGGKSTLIDILLGFLDPKVGGILIDGCLIDQSQKKCWIKNVTHVSQSIFIADTSIEKNIAFGVDEKNIDQDLIRKVSDIACIKEYIEQLPNGYQTEVGEAGIRLSGGQRQRIGIARALYRRAPILVLDEATSALDNETEEKIMKALMMHSENLTIISVTHRNSTLKYANKIYSLSDGCLEDVSREWGK